MPGFVHLHVHSSYSLLEGALTIGRLCELAKADRQPALALTDTDNMFGALEFSDKMPADRRLRARDRFCRSRGPPARRKCAPRPDRKSTRLNSSHITISYAVFCL